MSKYVARVYGWFDIEVEAESPEAAEDAVWGPDDDCNSIFEFEFDVKWEEWTDVRVREAS